MKDSCVLDRASLNSRGVLAQDLLHHVTNEIKPSILTQGIAFIFYLENYQFGYIRNLTN